MPYHVRHAWLVLVAATAAGALGNGVANTALGCNAGGPTNRGLVFADMVKSSTFGQPAIPGSQNVTVDAKGWPTQDFSVLWYDEPGGYYFPAADLSGTYTLTALGCATVSIPERFGGVTIVNQSCAPHLLAYIEVSSDGDAVHGHAALAFTGTTRGAGAGGGLTNVSLLQPGYAVGTDPDTLHEPALANMRGRCTVTRFLGWAFYGHTAWDGITPPTPCVWSLRPRLGDPSYFLGGWGTFGMGVPFEIIARIVNAIGSDVWLNIPSTTNETARDEYASNALALFDAMLPAGRRIYIEHANECFFGNNQCYPDDVSTANTSVLQRGDPYKLNWGLPTPPNATADLIAHWAPRMYAYTALHYAQLAAQLVGPARVGRADTPGVRVVPVVGALGSYAADAEGKLAWLAAAWGTPAATGLATINIGGYVSAARNITSDPACTADQVITSLLANIAALGTDSPVAFTQPFAEFAAVSAFYGVAVHAYEGGPDTSGGKGAGVVALGEADRDPRMADAVEGIVRNWQSWGLGTFNYFTLGAQPLEQPWGSYTNLWDMKVPDTPKSRGIDRIVSTPPAPLAAGWPAPLVNHSAAFYVGYYTKDTLPPPYAPVTWLPLNLTMSYLVRFAAPCTGGINVTVTMTGMAKSEGGDPLQVLVGAFAPPVTIVSPPSNGTRRDWRAVTALFPPLPPAALANGLVTVRLRVPVAGVKYELLAIDVSCR